jgi:hypothetical protein
MSGSKARPTFKMILPGNRTRLNGACPSNIVAPIDSQDLSPIQPYSAAAGAGAAVMMVVAAMGMIVATRRTGRASSDQPQCTQGK